MSPTAAQMMCANGTAFHQSACVQPLQVQMSIHYYNGAARGLTYIMKEVDRADGHYKGHLSESPMSSDVWCRASDRRFKTVFKAVRPNVAMF